MIVKNSGHWNSIWGDSGKPIWAPDSNPDSGRLRSGFNSGTISRPQSRTDSGENHANCKFGQPSIREHM